MLLFKNIKQACNNEWSTWKHTMQPNHNNMYQKPTAKLNKLVQYKQMEWLTIWQRRRFLGKKKMLSWIRSNYHKNEAMYKWSHCIRCDQEKWVAQNKAPGSIKVYFVHCALVSTLPHLLMSFLDISEVVSLPRCSFKLLSLCSGKKSD